MKRKNTIKSTAALMLGLALTVGATGCSFVLTDSEADLKQTVATVDISSTLKEDAAYKDVASTVSEMIGDAKISKSDLVTSFLSYGYQYVQNYGYSYADTFNLLLDSLVSREILIQYAAAYFLAKNSALATGYEAYETKEKKGMSEKELELHEKYPEVLTFKYFLTNGGVALEEGEKDYYNSTVYALNKSLNSSLDSLEAEFITEEHEHASSTDSVQTLPTNVGTEKSDYFTTEYGVYTGRNTLDACGEYEAQFGSTTVTRRKAYNSFLANLRSYNLIGKGEDASDVTHLDYYYVELSSSLGQALINKYYESVEAEVEGKLTAEYVSAKYESILEEQERLYSSDPTAFKTAIDGISESSFVLYGLKNYGYVYNILLPFSNAQNVEYSQYKNQGLTTNELYSKRNKVLAKVTGEDLRDSWISEDEHSNYSYVVTEDGADKYYFFNDNLNNTAKYESLKFYANAYPYNGTVTETDDGYEFKGNKMSVQNVLKDMLALITKTTNGAAKIDKTDAQIDADFEAYYNAPAYTEDAEGNIKYTYLNDDGTVNYKSFIATSGKIDLGNASDADFFTKGTTAYNALSAVNEIMFAYSTDSGCLNTYMGYVVSPYGSNYMLEFEEAAQWCVEQGEGAYAVCPTDYGWHIIYCSFKYDGCEVCAAGGDCGEKLCGGSVYGAYDHLQAVGGVNEQGEKVEKVEGSFSNLFYESLKSTMIGSSTNEKQSMVLNKYNNNASVKRYQKAYQDLLDM